MDRRTKLTLAKVVIALLLVLVLASLSAKRQAPKLLLHAASRGSIPMMRVLVRLGVDPASNAAGAYPLYAAVSHGQHAAAGLLLAAGSPVDSVERDGATPLMRAAALGDTRAVELLLAHGASTQARMGCGNALDIARANRQDSVARLLEQAAGARPAAPSR